MAKDDEMTELVIEDSRRSAMVRTQLRARGIRDSRVLDAMAAVPRDLFVPGPFRDDAYSDCALPIGEGQTISQPYMVARAAELAELRGDELVLDVGTGSGYQAAVVAQIARRVISIERIPELAARAERALDRAGIRNVTVLVGDGSQGHPSEAPYDRILVAAGAPYVPDALIDQLVVGGLLVIPIGTSDLQRLRVVRKTLDGVLDEAYDPCVYVPLVYEGGWSRSPFSE